MRSVARPGVRGSAIAIVLLTGCGGGHPLPAPAPAAARAAAAPIDTTGLPRIRFPRGSTSGINDDKLGAGATRSYVLHAQGGQVMLVHAISWPVAEAEHPPPEPEVRVYEAATGRELPSPRGEPEVWSARLPGTGDYIIRVTAKARNTSLSNEESTDDKLDDTAAGSWKSTGLAESLLHAARPAVKRATIPARKNNRILPPAESLRRESKCACPWPESL